MSSRGERTTVQIDVETNALLDKLVGRFGRSKGDVVRAGAECLLAKLSPLPTEARR